MPDRNKKRLLTRSAQFETREDQGQPHICGYFAVFDDKYELWDEVTETIDKGAFDDQLDGDVRALINHDTTLVLGRTKAGTLVLRVDDHGLWGDIAINPDDQDAMNLYARVKRGDVSQCSFGFSIREEKFDKDGNDHYHWTILSVDLYEVSVCTFPAYESTEVEARREDVHNLNKRAVDIWREQTRKKLRREKHAEAGTAGTQDPGKERGAQNA